MSTTRVMHPTNILAALPTTRPALQASLLRKLYSTAAVTTTATDRNPPDEQQTHYRPVGNDSLAKRDEARKIHGAAKTNVPKVFARSPAARRARRRPSVRTGTPSDEASSADSIGSPEIDSVTRASDGARRMGLVGRAAAVKEGAEAKEPGLRDWGLGERVRVPFEPAGEASQRFRPASSSKESEIERKLYRFSTAKDRYDVLNLFADSRLMRGEAEVESSSGRSKQHLPIPRRWLRDHCQCPKCIHPETKQRNIDIFEMSEECWDMAKCDIHESTVHITWKDGHESSYDLNWIRRVFCAVPTVSDRQGLTPIMQWDANNVNGPEVEVKYDDIMRSDRGVAELTRKVRRMGFCFIDGCQPTPEATESLLSRIGPIRTTHYGGFYDFTSDLSSKDTAYTSEALDVHTDTNYFTDPAGLQMFHLLSHEGTGGETQLVDGFQVAGVMHRTYPKLYDVLSRQTMFFHASGNEGTSIQPVRPVPTLVHDANERFLSQVRWNNADRGAFVSTVDSAGMVAEWYKAAKRFDSFLKQKDPQFRTEFQLKPGRPLIFDNWRVLHGRSAFTGKRRMAGGYINRDDFISRYRTSNFGHDEVLKHGVY